MSSKIMVLSILSVLLFACNARKNAPMVGADETVPGVAVADYAEATPQPTPRVNMKRVPSAQSGTTSAPPEIDTPQKLRDSERDNSVHANSNSHHGD